MLRSKFRATGRVEDLHRRPRRKITTPQQDRHMLITHLRDRKRNARQTARTTLGTHQRPISDQTVRNRLREHGLNARRPKVGIKLTARHRAVRRGWARRHARFTRAQWANVLFTDESRFTVSGHDGRGRVYRRRGERFAECCVQQRDRQRRASVMVWGGISFHNKTQLVVVNGNLNAARYQQEILRQHVIPYARANRGTILAQDNAPCHTARTTRQMLQANHVQTMEWPPCSPDMNPIEHVWDYIGRQARALREQRNAQELAADLVQVWNRLPQVMLQDYVTSMRQRCQEVIRANGGHTSY